MIAARIAEGWNMVGSLGLKEQLAKNVHFDTLDRKAPIPIPGLRGLGGCRCVAEGSTLLVPVTVVLEWEWVLRSSFGFGKDDVLTRLISRIA
jgi:hypothetical protein